MSRESLDTQINQSTERDTRAKTALFIVHTINDLLHSAEPKDVEHCQGELLDTLTELKQSFEGCIRQATARREIAIEASQADGELVDQITEKVDEIQRIHGSSQTAQQLTFNVHREVMEAAVVERFDAITLPPSGHMA